MTVADVYHNKYLENWQEMTKIRKPIIAAVSGYAVSNDHPLPVRPVFLFLFYSFVRSFDLIDRAAARGRLRTRADGRHPPGGAQRAIRTTGGSHRHDHGRWRLAAALARSGQVACDWSSRLRAASGAHTRLAAWGMASQVVAEGEGEVVREAVGLAREIADKSRVVVQAQKEAVNAGTVMRFFFFFFFWFSENQILISVCLSVFVWAVAFEQGLSEGLATERRLFHMTFATADQKEGVGYPPF